VTPLLVGRPGFKQDKKRISKPSMTAPEALLQVGGEKQNRKKRNSGVGKGQRSIGLGRNFVRRGRRKHKTPELFLLTTEENTQGWNGFNMRRVRQT